jgi:superkiller protein 3
LAAVAITSSDSDLIEASITELSTQSPEAKLAQDPAGHLDLVLFLHALSAPDQGEDQAVAALEQAVTTRSYDVVARNRLAKAMIATGRFEEAVSVLEGVGSADGALLSGCLRLKGVAEMVGGGERSETGIGMIQKSVVVRPWETAGWEALAWAKAVDVE